MTNVMPALYRGLAVAGILSAIAFYYVSLQMFPQKVFEINDQTFSSTALFGSAVVGLVLTALTGIYY